MALFNIGKQRDEGMSNVVNSAKTLLANIRFMDVDHPIRTIAITSAVPNEGKTFVAANLASAIATSGKTVLLVETDMRRRSLSRVLGVHAQQGIYSVMAGENDLRSAAIPTPTPNLYFLDSEPRIPNPSDLLNSHRFTRLLDQAASMYDYVLFDTPPVGTFVDAAVLGTKVDAILMVVREGFTRKAEVVTAAEQLKKAGCNLAGIVMNYCERRSSEYYYEYYYTHDDGSSSNEGPKLQTPARPKRASVSQPSGEGGVPLPERPVRRRQASQAAAVAESAAVPAPAGDDTDVYERLAEQVAQSQQARASRPQTATPYIPRRSEDEF